MVDSDNEQFFSKLEGVINYNDNNKDVQRIFENSREMWTQNFNHCDVLFLLSKVHDTCVGPLFTPL